MINPFAKKTVGQRLSKHLTGPMFKKNLKAVFGKILFYIKDSEFNLLASAMAFTTTLSLIPLMAIAFAVFKNFGGVDKILQVWAPQMFDYLGIGTTDEFANRLSLILKKASGSALGLVGFITLAYTSTRLMSQIEKGVQKVWGLTKRHSLARRLAAYAFALFVVPTAGAILWGIISSSPLESTVKVQGRHILWAAEALIFFSVNKWVPRTKVHWASALIAAVATTVGFILLQSFFVGLTKNMLNYNRIYGSFASIPVFLLWLLWAWKLFFFGVSVCAGIDRRFFAHAPLGSE